MESISLTATILLPILIFQKPSGKLKSKTVHAHIHRHLDLWTGDFDSLMNEGCTIHKCLSFHSKPNHSQLSHSFSNLMLVEKLRLLFAY